MRRFLILSLNNDPALPLGTQHAGGQTKYVLELTKNLLAQGHSVEVFTIGHGEVPQREEFVPGAHVTRFMRSMGKPYDYDITEHEIRLIASEICSYVEANLCAFDLILCCYWVSGQAAIALKAKLNCPLIVTFCSLAALKRLSPGAPNVEVRFEAERALGQIADSIIATSQIEQTILEQDYQLSSEKIKVIPRGIDLAMFHP